MKYNCFIDASSYINLSLDDCYLNGKTLLNLLSEEVNIKFSYEVNNEISRHHTILMPDSLDRSSKVYRLQKKPKTYKDYELKLFGEISKSKDKNRGEKHNFIASVDFFITEKRPGIIFLCDDNKAVDGILNQSIKSFPFCHTWTSFDVILYLMVVNKHFIKDYAEAAVKDISAQLAKNYTPQTSHNKTELRLKVFSNYMRYINIIHKTLKK